MEVDVFLSICSFDAISSPELEDCVFDAGSQKPPVALLSPFPLEMGLQAYTGRLACYMQSPFSSSCSSVSVCLELGQWCHPPEDMPEGNRNTINKDTRQICCAGQTGKYEHTACGLAPGEVSGYKSHDIVLVGWYYESGAVPPWCT